MEQRDPRGQSATAVGQLKAYEQSKAGGQTTRGGFGRVGIISINVSPSSMAPMGRRVKAREVLEYMTFLFFMEIHYSRKF